MGRKCNHHFFSHLQTHHQESDGSGVQAQQGDAQQGRLHHLHPGAASTFSSSWISNDSDVVNTHVWTFFWISVWSQHPRADQEEEDGKVSGTKRSGLKSKVTTHLTAFPLQHIRYHFKREEIEFPIIQRINSVFRRATNKWKVLWTQCLCRNYREYLAFSASKCLNTSLTISVHITWKSNSFVDMSQLFEVNGQYLSGARFCCF